MIFFFIEMLNLIVCKYT